MLSIESQTREMKELAARLNLPVDEILFEAKSAKAPGRPVFDRMMKQVHKGEVAGIICWKLDRLARNPVDGGSIIWAIKQKDIKIITQTQTYSREDDNVILMYIEFGMAQKYVDDLSRNVKLGLKTKLKNGWYPAKALPGYLNHTDKTTRENTLVKDPERFQLVRQMWDLMLAGRHTPPQIIDIANQKWGLRTRPSRMTGGRPFARSAIYKIFTNPFYYGRFEFPRGSGRWYQGKHEPMITKAEYDRVQLMLGRDGNPRPQSQTTFAYTGLIRCGDCGLSVTAEEKHQIICSRCRFKFAHRRQVACPQCEIPLASMTKPLFLHYTYYHCSKSGRPICRQKSIKLEELERQILEQFGKINLSKEFRDWAVEFVHQFHGIKKSSLEQIIASNRIAYQDCEKQIQNLLVLKTSPRNHDDSLLSDEEYTQRRGELLKTKKMLEDALEDTEGRLEQALRLSEQVIDFACLAQERFAQANPNEKKRMITIIQSNLKIIRQNKVIPSLRPMYLVQGGAKGTMFEP